MQANFLAHMNELSLRECLEQIEAKLGWGSPADWLNQDFQLLSDRIFEETKVRLSITTLKRVWGKVSYNSAPSISTLNTLALFLGYENWSSFRQSVQAATPEPAPAAVTTKVEAKTRYPKLAVAAVLALVAISTVALLAFTHSDSSQPYSEDELKNVTFSSAPVTLGLPNSVVFHYDYAGLAPEYTAIQQSWNDALTFEVDHAGKEATGIYYYPGYFRAKLIADGQILKEHDIHIRTDGWMATIGEQEIPHYLYAEEITREGALKLASKTFNEVQDMNLEEAPLLTYHYFDDFGYVPGDDFAFETRFRNTYRKSNGVCQRVNILVHGKHSVILVPFSIPGCISDLSIFTMGMSIDGKSNDLSAFGTDMHNWQDLKVISKDLNIQIYLNDAMIYEFTAPASIGDVVGFKYRFMGAGEVDYVKLTGPNGGALEENFEANELRLSRAD